MATNEHILKYITPKRVVNNSFNFSASNSNFTHVLTTRPLGRYCIERKDTDEFWNVYTKTRNEEKDFICGLAEMPQEYAMLVLDADIKTQTPVEDITALGKKLYQPKHYLEVIKIYQTLLRKLIKNVKNEHLYCVLLEKEPYQDENKFIRNGFHLAFVNLFLSKAEVDFYLNPKLVDLVDEAKIFHDLGYPISSKVLDLSKTRNRPKPWLLYGSCKHQDTGSYTVTKAFDHDGDEMSIEEIFDDYKIYNSKEEEIKIDTENLNDFLPRILSINPNGRAISEVLTKQEVKFDDNKGSNIQFGDEKDEEEPELTDKKLGEVISTATELLELLSEERVDNHDAWLEVGWVMFSISSGAIQALDVWVEWSEKVQTQHDRSRVRCINEWGKMFKGKFTIGTLKYFARVDNPEGYKAYQERRSRSHINRAIYNNSHYDFACSLYELYSDVFVCASIDPKPVWYYFEDHHWTISEKAIDLKKKIASDLMKKFTQISIELLQEKTEALGNEEDEEKMKNLDSKLKQVSAVSKNLGKNTFKKAIIAEAEELFYDRTFIKKLGQNRHLVGFKNGIYDLKTHTLRDGKPEDYVTLQMNANYVEYDENDPLVTEIKDYIEKVFPDRSIREYFINISGEYFIGGNPRKLVQVWNGNGDNAKTITMQIIQEMFGPYAIEIPVTVLTGPPPKAGCAFPEIDRAGDGARVMVAQETNHRELINLGTFKKFSGGDKFFVRNVFEKGREVLPQFKLILLCNNLPRLPCDDPAAWSRIRVLPFESKFCDNAPEDVDEQFRQKRFPIDRSFADRIPQLTEPLAWYLLQNLKNRGNKKVVEPEKVLQATEKYRKDNDFYLQYVEERVTADEKSIIHISELYADFKDWFKTSCSGQPLPTKKELVEYFEMKWGNMMVGMRFSGYKIRNIKDDVEAGRAVVPDAGYFTAPVLSNNPRDLLK